MDKNGSPPNETARRVRETRKPLGIRISNPIAVRFTGLVLAWSIRLWGVTLETLFDLDDPQVVPGRMKRPGIYLFWHEMMTFPAYAHSRQGIPILVSQHRDGEILAQVVRMLGGKSIRGSTRRGGAAARRKMMRAGRLRHLAITPDGPLGPRRVVQPGAIYLASRAGMPLVPLGYAYEKCWRANSWDRTVVPKPFCRARCVSGRLIELSGDLDRDGLEQARLRVQAAMDDVQARAEHLAAGARAEKPLWPMAKILERP